MPATPELPDDAPSIGKGRYALVSRIGEGGMAAVYRAWDKKLRVWRAVKVLLPEFARRRKVRARFESEAHTMARLEHDNLVKIYDVSDAGELPFIVMELVDGGTLQGWTKRHGEMPPKMAVDMTMGLARGVLVAHSAGIVHRDIKPQNVLISDTGQCKLTDFGIAHVDDDGMTRTGSVLGTLGYMAPEQRNDAKSVDQRADIYSIGATLWHLLTAEVAQDLFLAVENPKLLAQVAEPLRVVVCRCVAYERHDRYPDVRTLVTALEAVYPLLGEVPRETPGIVQDTTEEEIPLEDTDFNEIQALLDAGGIQTRPAEATTHAETPRPDRTTDASRPAAPTSKAPLPYFMPQADRKARRRPSLVEKTDEDSLPDWVDQDSLPHGPPKEEEPAVIGVDGSKTPFVPDRLEDRPSLQGEPPKVLKSVPPTSRSLSREGEPPRRKSEPPQPSPVDPRTPATLQPATPAAAPEEESSSAPLLGFLAVAVGLALVAVTLVVLGFGVLFGRAATELQVAEKSAVDSRAKLNAILHDERMIVDQLAVLGADRGTLEAAYLQFEETKAEPARSRAAVAFLEAMDREAREVRIDDGGSISEVEATRTLRRIRAAREAYEASVAAWQAAADGPRGQLVILLGAASPPQ